ncbi:Hypothetical protein PACV_113 [Pacmanvirus A23]|uniref:Hypothetical protein n=1 Tax=Pacmanvirus A23 TaxID=1932881 RepID=UPI000A092E86|nr:Hypothetical protein B9W72_gp112 [Pacmanvirus A23]SIP85829.1 Hypothetical protein PACV_113 [Pacmanvirus A23]
MNEIKTNDNLCKKCGKKMSNWEYHPNICCFAFYQRTYGVKDYCIGFPNITETEAKYKIIHTFYQSIGRTQMQKMMYDKAMYLEDISINASKMKNKIKLSYKCSIIRKFEIYGDLPNEIIEIIAKEI